MIAFAFALQIVATSTPPAGDTIGYWQQRVHYRIAARLDERSAILHASGTLVYVNNSPDSLRELYFHQYLNAFRPGSKWSAVDEREGRTRFQLLADPDYAFERFTEPVEVRMPGSREWITVTPSWPGAPDSTVVRFALPSPLAPGDSLIVLFRWDARVSTVFRRQGRRGRHYDFAQWFPKVAVYDRGGWQHNALTPAGELYGEFGTYDVTLLVAEDQVIGASGVVVSGDPGWERARRWGNVFKTRLPSAANEPDTLMVPEGFKAVRWIAENVHHFAWSVSPDFRYEGGVYVRPAGMTNAGHAPSFDTVAINVLYRPGDEPTWGNGIVVQRVVTALRWLEQLYGFYAWPQLTSLHRLDSGGTEMPMMMMNGSPSIGLNLHEGGHMFSYGILANNEWRAGWLDEGLTSYQTGWAQGLTAPERAKKPPVGVPEKGYQRHAPEPLSFEKTQIEQLRLSFIGAMQPIGTPAPAVREFAISNAAIYTRAERMYGALRDVMGDSVFVAFLHDYYNGWALRHVDELAMRTSAERVYGKPLDWFFDQWVHRTGEIDYALETARVLADSAGWLTSARVVQRGSYQHPMPVGVRTGAGWTIARADPLSGRQTVEIRTAGKPIEVALDPERVTDDWDRRNNAASNRARKVFAWPFLEHVDRNRSVVTLRPEGWYSDPGGLAVGFRARSSYQGWIDRQDLGLAYTTRARERVFDSFGDVADFRGPSRRLTRIQGWVATENPRRDNSAQPSVGLATGAWFLDGIFKFDLRRRINRDEFAIAKGKRAHQTFGLTGTFIYDQNWPDPRRWSASQAIDLSFEYETDLRRRSGRSMRAFLNAGTTNLGGESDESLPGSGNGLFGRVELELKSVRPNGEDDGRFANARLFIGLNMDTPLERSTLVSSANATQTFANHYVRPRGGLLAPPEHPTELQRSLSYLVPGGALMRGYDPLLRLPGIAALNLERGYRLKMRLPTSKLPSLWVHAFADWGLPISDEFTSLRNELLADAGAGISLRGRMYDRPYVLRFDAPIYVRQTHGPLGPLNQEIAFRLVVSATDIW